MTDYLDLLDDDTRKELSDLMHDKKSNHSQKELKRRFLRSLSAVAIVTLSLVGGFLLLRGGIGEPVQIALVDNPAGSIDLSFSPSSLSMQPGTEKMVDLRISAGSRQVLAAQVELLYDTGSFEPPIVTKGSFFSDELAAAKVENGKITFTYAEPPNGGKSGSGVVARIKLKPKVSGSLTLAVTNNSEVYESSNLTTNALRSAADLTINSGNPSPSPSASSSPVSSMSPAPSSSATPSGSPKASASVKASKSPKASASPKSSPSSKASAIASPKASPTSQATSTPTPKASAGVGGQQAPSALTTLRQSGETTCSSLTFSWDLLTQAKGYHLEVSDQSNFATKVATFDLNKDTSSQTVSNLRASTTYHARITQTNIHDYPRYTTLSGINTPSCPTVAASTTPSSSPIVKTTTSATPKATPSASPSIADFEFGTVSSEAPAPDLSDLNQEEREQVDTQVADSTPNFWQAIILGWKDIIDRFLSLFR